MVLTQPPTQDTKGNLIFDRRLNIALNEREMVDIYNSVFLSTLLLCTPPLDQLLLPSEPEAIRVRGLLRGDDDRKGFSREKKNHWNRLVSTIIAGGFFFFTGCLGTYLKIRVQRTPMLYRLGKNQLRRLAAR